MHHCICTVYCASPSKMLVYILRWGGKRHWRAGGKSGLVNQLMISGNCDLCVFVYLCVWVRLCLLVCVYLCVFVFICVCVFCFCKVYDTPRYSKKAKESRRDNCAGRFTGDQLVPTVPSPNGLVPSSLDHCSSAQVLALLLFGENGPTLSTWSLTNANSPLCCNVPVHCREEWCIGNLGESLGPQDRKSLPSRNLLDLGGCIYQCIPTRGSVQPFSQH